MTEPADTSGRPPADSGQLPPAGPPHDRGKAGRILQTREFLSLTPDGIREEVRQQIDQYVQVLHDFGYIHVTREQIEQGDTEGLPELPPGLRMKMVVARQCEYMRDGDAEAMLWYIDRLERDVMVDRLTGVKNRAQYDEYMDRIFAEKARYEGHGREVPPTAMAIIDIDNFHQINGSVGHPVGDIILRKFFDIIQASLPRRSDTVFRYGGEEAVVIMRNTSADQAAIAMERCRENIQQNLVADVIAELDTYPDELKAKIAELRLLEEITASIGISELRDHHTTETDLFTETDIAMYKAKTGEDQPDHPGRNLVTVFQPGMEKPEAAADSEDRDSWSEETTDSIVFDLSGFQASIQEPAEIIESYHANARESFDLQRDSDPEDTFMAVDVQEGIQFLMGQERMAEHLQSQAPDDLIAFHSAFEQIVADARIDSLTRLPNRLAFEEEWEERVAVIARRADKAYVVKTEVDDDSGQPVENFVLREGESVPRSVSLLMFDMDKFKLVNDTCGHRFGDLCLRAMGDVLQGFTSPEHDQVPGIARDSEATVRFSGEEFGVLLDTDDPREVKLAAQRFVTQIRERLFRVRRDDDGAITAIEGRVAELARQLGRQYSPEQLAELRDAITVSIGAFPVELVATGSPILSDEGGASLRVAHTTPTLDVVKEGADMMLYVAKGDIPEVLQPSAKDSPEQAQKKERARELLQQLRDALVQSQLATDPAEEDAEGNCSNTEHGRDRYVFADHKLREILALYREQEREIAAEQKAAAKKAAAADKE